MVLVIRSCRERARRKRGVGTLGDDEGGRRRSRSRSPREHLRKKRCAGVGVVLEPDHPTDGLAGRRLSARDTGCAARLPDHRTPDGGFAGWAVREQDHDRAAGRFVGSAYPDGR